MNTRHHTIETYTDISKIPSGHASGTVTPGCIVLEGGAFRGLYSQGVLPIVGQGPSWDPQTVREGAGRGRDGLTVAV